jgi:Ca2+-binding RTX toxin-like protein
VTGVNDAPVISNAVVAGLPVGTVGAGGLVVGSFLATDIDIEALTLTTDNPDFEIRQAGAGYEVVAKAGTVFDAFTGDVTVTVTASDGTTFDTEPLHFGTPIGGSSILAVDEEAVLNASAGSIEPLGLTNATYQLLSSAVPFTVTPGGEVRVNGPLNFEAVSTYSFDVRVTGDQGTITRTVSVSVDDIQTQGSGGSGDDTLTGTAGEDTRLGLGGNDLITLGARDDIGRGGANNDTINGGLGADTIDGGTGTDFASYADAAAGTTAWLIAPSMNSGEAIGDVYIDIEGLIGSAFDDILIGDFAANTLYGGLGSDRMDGLFGGDTLFGGDGNDYLVSRSGQDSLDGGFGYDFAIFFGSASDMVVDLENGANNTGDAAGDVLVSVEGVLTGDFNDKLYGNAIGNYLAGGAGNDMIFGRDGQDYIRGGLGGDYLWGGNGQTDSADDTFSFFASDLQAGVRDYVFDFTGGNERIEWVGIGAAQLNFASYTSGATSGVFVTADFGGGTAELFFYNTTIAQLQASSVFL